MTSDDNGTVPILGDTDDPSNDNELDGQTDCCSRLACCDPKSSTHRFMALILMCLLGFGEYTSCRMFILIHQSQIQFVELSYTIYVLRATEKKMFFTKMRVNPMCLLL